MKPMLVLLNGALLLCAIASASAAPTTDDYRHSLELRERLITLTENVAWPAKWLSSNRFYYRKSVKGGFAWVIMNAETLEKTPAFDHDRLAAALSHASGKRYAPLLMPFESMDFVDDERALTMWVGEKQWHCRLDDYVCASGRGRAAGQPRAFGVVRDLSVPANDQPVRSPDGAHEAFVENHNVVVRALDDGATRTLSKDGKLGDFYDPESLRWSPDSRRLAAYRVKPGFKREVFRVEASPRDQSQPKLQTQLYPKPGDAVDIDRPVLFDLASERTIEIDHALFANPFSMSPIRWRKDGKSFSFDVIQRGHQQLRMIAVDAENGRAHAAVTEDSRTFVDTWNGFRQELGDDGGEVLGMSERDGWRHLYLFDSSTGKVKNRVTRGEWVVRKVLHVDQHKRRVWFTASGMDAGMDPYYRHLFRVDLDGRNLVRLTSADADHEASVAGDGRHYLVTPSRVDLPPVMRLYDADGGDALVAEVERADISALVAAGWRAPEVFVAKGRDGKTDIWGLVVRPRDYDPSKKYPVIESIYAGPHDSFVPKSFWPFGFHSGGDKAMGMQAQADLGFIVVQMDGMGTANRSKAFHDVAWKNLGDSGFPDRIAWHRALAAKDPSYDISRVGIYGASAGGQSTLGALLFHPDFYKAGVAYNGCYDNRMDKISWNEQWLGWPVDDSYARASGVDNAHRLQGNLLLIVGEQDSNVDPASTMQVVDALILAGKDFDLLSLPGEGHAVGRSTGPVDYVQRRQFDFFVRHLQREDTPRWNELADAVKTK